MKPRDLHAGLAEVSPPPPMRVNEVAAHDAGKGAAWLDAFSARKSMEAIDLLSLLAFNGTLKSEDKPSNSPEI